MRVSTASMVHVLLSSGGDPVLRGVGLRMGADMKTRPRIYSEKVSVSNKSLVKREKL